MQEEKREVRDGPFPLPVVEHAVQPLSIHECPTMVQAVELVLHDEPVVFVSPVVNELFQARISDFAVVPYRQDQSPRLDFWGSDVRNLTTEGDTRWVNYNTSHFSSRSTAS